MLLRAGESARRQRAGCSVLPPHDSDRSDRPLQRGALSQITPAMTPGVIPVPGEAQQRATIGVVLPHFQSILRGGRLGLHNIYPDPDGIAREYLVHRDDSGWKVPSLPARVMRELGYREPDSQRVLLNWRGNPFSYRMVSFSDVFNDMLNKNKRRPQD